MLFRVSARCIMIRNGRILVQLSKHGDFYRLPGGRVRPEETVLQGLRRELREELGLDIEADPVLAFVVESFYRRRNGVVHELGLYFLCHPPDGGAQIRPREEHLKISWVPLEDITPESFRPATLAGYLRSLRDGRRPSQAPVYLVNIDMGEE